MKERNEMDWKRTGNKEYPEENQTCLIYFAMTGFSISKFSWEYFEDKYGNVDKSLGKIACFNDRGGYLGNEDVLWMPMPKRYSQTASLKSGIPFGSS